MITSPPKQKSAIEALSSRRKSRFSGVAQESATISIRWRQKRDPYSPTQHVMNRNSMPTCDIQLPNIPNSQPHETMSQEIILGTWNFTNFRKLNEECFNMSRQANTPESGTRNEHAAEMQNVYENQAGRRDQCNKSSVQKDCHHNSRLLKIHKCPINKDPVT